MVTKTEQLIEWLSEKSDAKLDWSGGYPDAIWERDGYVAVASVDENGRPSVDIFTPTDVAIWHDRISAWRKRYPDSDITEAVYETWPEAE